MKDKFTPNYIESLEDNEVLCFWQQFGWISHRRCSKDCQRAFWSSMGQVFLNHPILGERLRAVTKALLTHTDMDVVDILGEVDAMKVCSCMTLFDVVSPDDVFQEVLDGFYKGKYDLKTLNYM